MNVSSCAIHVCDAFFFVTFFIIRKYKNHVIGYEAVHILGVEMVVLLSCNPDAFTF